MHKKNTNTNKKIKQSLEQEDIPYIVKDDDRRLLCNLDWQPLLRDLDAGQGNMQIHKT
jgi:hypothetical protein